MTNYSQLNKEQRETIQILLNKGKSFTDIGLSIGKDRTTISKEIKRNRYIKSYYYDEHDQKAILEACDKCNLLIKPPYVCNTCEKKNQCNKHHLYYDSRVAHNYYEKTKKECRMGVDILPETINEIESQIVPLIKNKKQSVNQVYTNHSDILYFCKSTQKSFPCKSISK